ncbi:Xylose isomerase domain-containing protein TIM barrel [Planctomycetales bacterium 10988]|nr:Xylose isomerase domain-containing protein TIM barrel [Planctomycetales bacterium 10988]
MSDTQQNNCWSRRRFLQTTATLAAGATLGLGASPSWAAPSAKKMWFKISLAQWSLHRMLKGGELDALDFAPYTKKEFGIEAVEYVNQFFMDHAQDQSYLSQLKQRAEDSGVKSLIIMIDREGDLGNPDEQARTTAVENHYKWVEAAKFLGCHSIRVNARSKGTYDEQLNYAADGLRRLTEFAQDFDINVIVENHGGLSSNGEWLASVIQKVDLPQCGTLPDFGNFYIDRKKNEMYDRYKGVRELMPFAKAVSAKTYDFDEKGNEATINYRRMLKLVADAGYRGYLGIEYEGKNLSEPEGIKASKKLLEKIGPKIQLSKQAEPATTG